MGSKYHFIDSNCFDRMSDGWEKEEVNRHDLLHNLCLYSLALQIVLTKQNNSYR